VIASQNSVLITARWRRQANVVKLLIDDRVYIFVPLILQSYWTEVHQIFTECRQIIVDEIF